MSEIKKEKSANWSEGETNSLIEFSIEENIPSLMDGKKFRNSDIFSKIREQMLQLGYDRSVSQLLVKYKQLKGKYKEETLKLGKSGGSATNWTFYSKMKELLYNRPVECFPEQYGIDPKPRTNSFADAVPSTSDNNDQRPNERPADIFIEEHHTFPIDDIIVEELSETDDIVLESQKRKFGNKAIPKRSKRKTYSTALAEFSNSFFEKQRQLNKEFILEQKNLIKEEREYDEGARSEDRIFFQTLLMHHTKSNI